MAGFAFYLTAFDFYLAGFDFYFGDDVINQPPFLWIEDNRCLTLPTLPNHPKILHGSSNGPCTPDWDQAKVHYNLGVVHQLQGLVGAAGVAYREAARLDPDYARTQATDEDSTAKRTAEA